jgi:hypothetical protein
MWVPERMDSPITSTSSWMAVATICSGLVEAGVDDLEASVPERPRHHLGAAVVTVQPWLGDEYPDLALGHPHLALSLRGKGGTVL